MGERDLGEVEDVEGVSEDSMGWRGSSESSEGKNVGEGIEGVPMGVNGRIRRA